MSTKCLILFGSETGTAEEISYRLYAKAKPLFSETLVMAMDEYDISSLPEEKLVIFVASTTGDGDSPYNMKKFWNFLLRKSLSAESLSLMNYAVFGLGDSSYEHFNAVARFSMFY
jgi:sulfite reductase alpha subunit-like flavoprotein